MPSDTTGAPPDDVVPVASLSGVRFRPRLPATLLLRPDLLRILLGWRTHRLTLITAPAGYGKTTLAATALHAALDAKDAALDAKDAAHATETPACHALWLALTNDDENPARFVFALGTTLAPLLPEAAESAARLVFGRNDPESALQLLLVAIEAIPAPVLIILDDFHRAQSNAVRDLMTLALEQGPENLHWMLTARHMTPLPLGRLRLLGEILEIDAEDLRLSPKEIEAYLHHAGVENLDPGTITLLEEQTQGWIAGLQLALLSLQRGRRKQTRNAHTLLHHLQGHNTLLAEYLTSEVLTQLPKRLRSFLMEISILEQLHPDLCSAVTGITSSRALLQEAMTRQLFLQQTEGNQEEYVMHQLFRELLLRQLKTERKPNAVQALHRRAADWFLAHNQVTQAIHILLDGNTPHLAAEVVQSRTRPALLEHRLADVRHWIHLLPPDLVDERIPLLLDLGWSFWAGTITELQQVLERLRRTLAQQMNIPHTLRDEAAALELLQRHVDVHDHTLLIDALAAEADFSPDSHHARGWVLLILCYNSRNLDRLATASRALAAFRAAGYPRGELLVHAWQTTEYTLLGDAEALIESCRNGYEIAAQQTYPDPTDFGFFLTTLAETLYWLDRIDEARTILYKLLADMQQINSALYQLIARARLDLCDIAQGSPPTFAQPQARAEEERLWQLFKAEGNSLYAEMLVAILHMTREIASGNPAGVWAFYQHPNITPETLKDDDSPAIALVVLTACVERGEDLEALSQHLDRLIEQYHTRGKPIYALHLQILRARQLQLLGRRNAARSALRHLLHEVERCGYVRLILDQPTLAPLLRAIQTDFALALATRMEQRPTAPRPELSEQQLTILRLLAKGQGMEEIAARLVISLNTVKWHLTRIYAKLGVDNRKQAIAAAHTRSLL